MSPELFPLRDAGKTLKVNAIWALARCTDAGSYKLVLSLPLPAGSDTLTLATGGGDQYGSLHHDRLKVASTVSFAPRGTPAKWQLKMTRPGGGNLIEDPTRKVMEVEDLLLVLGYEWD